MTTCPSEAHNREAVQRDAYEREVLRLALQIMAKHDESREKCLMECERIIHEIVDNQSHFGFHLEHAEDFMEPGTGVGAAYAMTLAVGVFAALNARDASPNSPAYVFSRALQWRAAISDQGTPLSKDRQITNS
jgi:hypothetical protein